MTKHERITTVEERFTSALHGTYRAWRAALDRRMKDLGVSQAGWLAIAYIAKSTGPLSQSELANLVQVEAATMVSTLDRLEKAGLVVRVASETDRRVKHVTLTGDGEAIFHQVKDKADGLRADLFGQIEPSRLSAATELLAQLQTIIENS